MTTRQIDVALSRADFPALKQQINSHPLVYLDNAASTQKPQSVIDSLVSFYEKDNANVHRGVHALSWRASEAYDQSRARVHRFLNAAKHDHIVFTRGTTDAINMIASAYLGDTLSSSDCVVITEMEHHSNIIPWQQRCLQSGAELRVVKVLDSGEIDWDDFLSALTPNVRLLSLSHASNVLGTVNPIKCMIDLAHDHGIPVVIDGAQGIVHKKVDVQALGCEAYVFSGHKLYGPTGIGVCYLRTDFAEKMSPYQTGGGMVQEVSFDQTTFADAPGCFEAGTPPIAQAVGLAAAIDYIDGFDQKKLGEYEATLSDYLYHRLRSINGLTLYGPETNRIGVFSFSLDKVHPHDVATVVDQLGVAVRAGHHCAMPLMKRYACGSMTRASLACYNNNDDIDALVDALGYVIDLFA